MKIYYESKLSMQSNYVVMDEKKMFDKEKDGGYLQIKRESIKKLFV